jgi:hypothetical protein
VTRAFAFLSDFGFLQVESSPTIVRYRKGNVEINIYHGRQSYELGFEVSRDGTSYSISSIIRATDPETGKKYRNTAATTNTVLAQGLVKLVELVRQYGQRALSCDPDFFAELARQRKKWTEEYAIEVLESQLRPKADEAFRQGRYREAIDLYERFRPRLTPADLKKLEIAKRKAGVN